MPIRALKNQNGQMVVFTMLIFPVLVVLMIFTLNYAVLVHSKIKLQIAADRAIFAGTARLAYIMNQIAQENWAINRAFRRAVDNFNPNSQQSSDECNQRITQMLNAHQAAGSNIMQMIGSAYDEANAVVNDVLAANHPTAQFLPVYGARGQPLLDIVEMGDPNGEQRRDITCSNISGFVFSPDNYNSQTRIGQLRYLYMNSETSFVGIAGEFSVNFDAPLLRRLFNSIWLRATSAGQPYGGSIKYFGLIATETVEEAVDAATGLTSAGSAYWYRPALVPVAAFYEKIQMERPNGEAYYH